MAKLWLRKETMWSALCGKPMHLPVVAYYRDAAATDLVCRNAWPSRPTRRNRYVMHNCSRFTAEWLPDLTGANVRWPVRIHIPGRSRVEHV